MLPRSGSIVTSAEICEPASRPDPTPPLDSQMLCFYNRPGLARPGSAAPARPGPPGPARPSLASGPAWSGPACAKHLAGPSAGRRPAICIYCLFPFTHSAGQAQPALACPGLPRPVLPCPGLHGLPALPSPALPCPAWPALASFLSCFPSAHSAGQASPGLPGLPGLPCPASPCPALPCSVMPVSP